MTTLASRIWSQLEDHPWLTMTLAVLAQSWFCIGNRALWFSDEVRYANAYQNLVEHGNWMVLALNGQAYPDKPPVYFWFLWLIDTLTPVDMPQVFFIGSALSGLLFLFAAYWLARTLKFSKSISLASVLVLLSTFFLVALFHYSRMDLMFAAFIVAIHACFYRAFTEESQERWPIIGFVLAGIATLIKGPLAFIFPLLTIAIYLGWKGELKKLISRQMGLGLAAMLGILAAWVLGVMLAEGPKFLFDTVLGKHVIQRATRTFHHREPFHYYLVAFPLAWLPWTLFAFVSPVKRLFSIEHYAGLWATRHEAGPRAFLWIMFVSTFVFLSSLSGKVLIYILPMFPPLAILTADAMQNLKTEQKKRLWQLVGGLWLVFGAGLLVAGDLIPVPVPIRGMGIAACLLIAFGGAIVFAGRKGNKAALLCATVGLTLWLYPVGLLVAPSMDEAMSPERQGRIIAEYVEKGYTPMGYKIYSGIYSYYAGHNLRETNKAKEIEQWIAGEDKAVLAIRTRHWNEWKGRPDTLKIIDEQNIAGMDYYIAVKD